MLAFEEHVECHLPKSSNTMRDGKSEHRKDVNIDSLHPLASGTSGNPNADVRRDRTPKKPVAESQLTRKRRWLNRSSILGWCMRARAKVDLPAPPWPMRAAWACRSTENIWTSSDSSPSRPWNI